jgi:hypothetical protein
MPDRSWGGRVRLVTLAGTVPHPSAPSATLSNRSISLAWLLIVVVFVACRVNAVAIPLERDEGLFGYVGQVINSGGVPYRDAIDHKPPVVYFVYALALWILPPTTEAVHLFLHAYTFLTLITLFFVARSLASSTAAGLWTGGCFAVFSASPHIQGYSASTEMFMLLPISLSLLCAVRHGAGSGGAAVILSGAFGAAACLTKHTGVFAVAFVALYAVVAPAARRDPDDQPLRRALSGLALWSAGFAAPLLLAAGYFLGHGALAEALDWGLLFNFHYGADGEPAAMLSRWVTSIGPVVREQGGMLFVGLVYAVRAVLVRDPRGLVVVGFLASSLAATLPGYAYPHYFAQIAPAVALAAGLGLAEFGSALRLRRLVAIQSVVTVAMVAIPWSTNLDHYALGSPAELSRRHFGLNPFPEAEVVAEYIAARTDGQDQMFIHGSEAEILFLAERRSVTPFVLLYPLTRETYPDHRGHQARAWRDVRRGRPRYVLLVNVPQSVAWDGRAEMALLREVTDELKIAYDLEAVMTVEAPVGRLFERDRGSDLRRVAARYPHHIAIFRRR